MNTGALVGRALSARLYRIYGWYAVGFALFVLLLGLLEHRGITRQTIGYLFLGSTLLLYAYVGVINRTNDPNEYYVAGRRVPAADPSDRLREVLPADVAERVLARIADARARELPAEALENRALKFAARGIAPADVERAIDAHAARMEAARAAFHAGREGAVTGEEIEAGAEAMRQGVDGAAVSELAKSAPSGSK